MFNMHDLWHSSGQGVFQHHQGDFLQFGTALQWTGNGVAGKSLASFNWARRLLQWVLARILWVYASFQRYHSFNAGNLLDR
jgi:hypothetical protein